MVQVWGKVGPCILPFPLCLLEYRTLSKEGFWGSGPLSAW